MADLSQEETKKIQLKKIGEQLDQHFNFDRPNLTEQLIHLGENTDSAKEKLFDYCFSEKKILKIINKYNAKREDLNELYRILNIAGAGQWVNGYYVIAACFLFTDTLEYILSEHAKLSKNNYSKETVVRIASDLIQIFNEKE
jgi:benzoyl-CoA reductase/2-hydroxyglutaryl-CoA dehydratase subunit BcrC/BadD/HgdB